MENIRIKTTKHYTIQEDGTLKKFHSKDLNYVFNKKTGFHAQWGKTKEENPERSHYGPIIADIEVVSMCKGPGVTDPTNKGKGHLCSFCYKANTPKGEYMTLESFKTIFKKLPPTLTQIAFGADADCSLNPDLFLMMDYCRNNEYNYVIPNITVADITQETANKLGKVCGAVSVSWYGMHTKKEYCYDSIFKLSTQLRSVVDGNTLESINMHFMLSKETLPYINELIDDIKNDKRLEKLNAVVFLSLKQKGRGTTFNGCTQEEFNGVVKLMMENGIGFGFDSCTAPKWIKSIEGHPRESEFVEMSEPCESTSFSLYINEKGQCVPCSFMEKMDWNGVSDVTYFDMLSEDIKNSKDFLDKVWNSKEYLEFGNKARKCVDCGNGCQIYHI